MVLHSACAQSKRVCGQTNSAGGMGGVAPHRKLVRVQESGREASPTNALTRAVRA
jgi:hypothetical protein